MNCIMKHIYANWPTVVCTQDKEGMATIDLSTCLCGVDGKMGELSQCTSVSGHCYIKLYAREMKVPFATPESFDIYIYVCWNM